MRRYTDNPILGLVLGMVLSWTVLTALEQATPTLTLNFAEGATIKGRVLLMATAEHLTTRVTCDLRFGGQVLNPSVTWVTTSTPQAISPGATLRVLVETTHLPEDVAVEVVFTVTPEGGAPLVLRRTLLVDNVPPVIVPPQPPTIVKVPLAAAANGTGYVELLKPSLPTDVIDLVGYSFTAEGVGTVRLMTGQGSHCRDGRRNLTFAYPVSPTQTHHFFSQSLAPGDSLCLYQTQPTTATVVRGNGFATITRRQ